MASHLCFCASYGCTTRDHLYKNKYPNIFTTWLTFFDDLEAPGAALRAMRLPPFFYLDVGPLGTLYIGMPRALAPNAPSIGAIRTLHHGVAVSRQINK